MRNLLTFLFVCSAAFGAAGADRWIVMLSDPPLAEVAVSARARSGAALASRHAAVRAEATRRGLAVTGSASTLLNAVFVAGREQDVQALRALPGVAGVLKARPLKRHLSRALDLVNAPAAWSTIGGQQNAGKGAKIAILDTGIDQNHPAFQDSSLAVPSGFPVCRTQDCPYTNSKVIVARSYVDSLALGFYGTGRPDDSRPDDLSPRDRVGHGTAMAMIAAGNTVKGPLATITGVAPKAWLGNYKIFGSPGVNDVTYTDVVVKALEDALADGMDVAVLSFGRPSLWGPGCSATKKTECDEWIPVIERAASEGLTVVTSAGNDGDLGHYPNLNSISTPGRAPSGMTVGATTNAHSLYATVEAVSADAPSTLRPAYSWLSDGPPFSADLTAKVVAAANDGFACQSLAAGSLNGAIALVRRGTCSFETKSINVQKAGAIALLLYRDSGDALFPLTGLTQTGIPAALIGATAGEALRQYLDSHADAQVTIKPALKEVAETSLANQIAYFSSQGPTVGDSAIKPELVAPGTGMYVATQKYDPNGDLYNATGYTVAQGTSFAAAMAAGAAALARQRFPRATPGQVKSLVVNTADPSSVTDVDANGQLVQPARVTAQGAGKLDLASVVKSTVTAEPATLSFGSVAGSLPSRTLKFTNLGATAVTLALSVSRRDADSGAQVNVSPSTVSLAAGGSGTATVQLTGATPAAGSYEGAVIVKGGAVDLRVPYLYLVGDGVPFNIYQVSGYNWLADTATKLELDFKVVDQFGMPAVNQSYKWTPSSLVDQAGDRTDDLGIGYAVVYAGSPGDQTFNVTAGSLSASFPGTSRTAPSIRADGVVDAASGQVGKGVAPGSYITIYGSGLSPSVRQSTTLYLPVSLAGASVSFDVPSASLSLPGRLYYVSDNQINVQVPWELQGQTSAQIKVSTPNSQTAVYTLPLNDFSPAFFEFADPGTGRLMVAALDEAYKVVYSANPVQRGHVLQLYVNGLGPVTNQPATGELSPAQNFATTQNPPAVTIGGQAATIAYTGLAPSLVGLYQVNVVVPSGIATGVQPVSLVINGITAKASSVVVQ